MDCSQFLVRKQLFIQKNIVSHLKYIILFITLLTQKNENKRPGRAQEDMFKAASL